MADPLKERISLLQIGEAQGKLKPEHQKELDSYRANGLAKGRQGTGPASRPLQSAGGQFETSRARDQARASLALIERLQPALDRVRHLQKTTLGKTGLAGLAEYNPVSQENQEYDSAASQLLALARPATRSPGEGAMSDFESKLAVAPLPNRWKMDAYNNESIAGLQRLIDTSKQLYGSQLGLPAAPPKRPAGSSGWKITRKQ